MGVRIKEEEVLGSNLSFVLQDLELNIEENNDDSLKTDSPPSLEEVEEILGYKFSDKTLLEETFTHPSLCDCSCVSYERLEFVGAAVLDMFIAREMFNLYPDFPPGRLTHLRAANVDTEKLARVAVNHGFHRYLRYKVTATDLNKQVQEFIEEMLKYPVHSKGIIDVPKFLAYVVDAIVGGMFLDSKSSLLDTNSSIVWKILKELLKPTIGPETLEMHPMTELSQLCQKNKLKFHFTKDSSNKENERQVHVLVDGNVVGTGTHRSKKEIAQNRAVKDALNNLLAGNLLELDFVHEEVWDRKMGVTKTAEEKFNDSFEGDPPLNLDGVEEILGYKFSDKSLLEEAFTHPSYYENQISMNDVPCIIMSYERLEFVGDAVLNMLIANLMYSLYPDLLPGPLTRLQAANVDNEKLARVAIKYGFHKYLRYKATHLDERIQQFNVAILDYPVHSNGLIDVPKFLADVVEAIVGAVFIDSNSCLDTVWKIIRELLQPMIGPDTLKVHPMTELREFCQKNKWKVHISKDLWNDNNEENMKRVDVFVDGNLVGTGTHVVKREIAQNWAAKAALHNLKETLLVATDSTATDGVNA